MFCTSFSVASFIPVSMCVVCVDMNLPSLFGSAGTDLGLFGQLTKVG